MSTPHMDAIFGRLDCLEHVVIAVIALAIAACTTTGYSITKSVTAPRTVRPPTYVDPELAPYLPRFVSVLETFGFHVGPTDDPRALQLRLEFDPNVFSMSVTPSLWQGGVAVVTAAARNRGFSTLWTPGAAIANLVGSAAQTFEGELKKVSSRLEITADTVPPVVRSSGGAKGDAKDDIIKSIERLRQLHDQGAITDQEFDMKKKELLDRL